MRRRSKASFSGSAHAAGSTVAANRKARGLFGLACLCVLGLVAFLGSSAPAVGAAGSFPGQGFLPDNRAWEMVSPPEKNGGDIEGEPAKTRAATNGDALSFASPQAFGDALGTGGIFSEYIARRTAAPGTQGWATHSISPEQDAYSAADGAFGLADPGYVGEFSDDLSHGVFLAKTNIPRGSSPAVADVRKLYLRDDLLTPGPGSYTLLSDCAAPPLGPCAAPLFSAPRVNIGFAAASADFTDLIFESRLALTDDAPDNGEPKLYRSDHGLLTLAGVLPDGTPAPSSAAGRGISARDRPAAYAPDTITEDGSRVLFTSPVESNYSQSLPTSDVFLRDDLGTPATADDQTIQLNSEENPLGTPSDGQAEFWAATPGVDGSGARIPLRVFFTSEESLTDEPLDQQNDPDLFLWQEAAPPGSRLTRISVDSELDDYASSDAGLAGKFTGSGVFGISESGDYVYFSARNQLVDDGQPGVTEHPCNQGTSCLFLWHQGVVREISSINTQVDTQFAVGLGIIPGLGGKGARSARVTPDGRRLLFTSEGNPRLDAAAGVPGYDHGACVGNGGPDPEPWGSGNNPGCAELYLYDATANGGAGRLRCASCNPTGVHASRWDSIFTYGGLLGGTSAQLSHPLSADGRFVFFTTMERLVAEDTNGQLDVYSYDTATEAHRLISSGESDSRSQFLDASADGRDVFFLTRERLSAWDRDSQADVYDARVGGGFPEPPPPPEACEGDACQPPPFSANDPSPASAGLSGPGDPRVRRCPKGRQPAKGKKRARCAKKPTNRKAHKTGRTH